MNAIEHSPGMKSLWTSPGYEARVEIKGNSPKPFPEAIALGYSLYGIPRPRSESWCLLQDIRECSLALYNSP